MSIVTFANPIHTTPQYADHTQISSGHIQWPQVEERPRHTQANRQTGCNQGHKWGERTFRDSKSAKKSAVRMNQQEEETYQKLLGNI